MAAGDLRLAAVCRPRGRRSRRGRQGARRPASVRRRASGMASWSAPSAQATRIALHYLRDAAEADEAVQDAFVKAYTHLATSRRRSFEVWFTRILVNRCLDRDQGPRTAGALDGGGRRSRGREPAGARGGAARTRRPKRSRLRASAATRLMGAIERLPERQRTVVLLSQIEGATTREVSEVTGCARRPSACTCSARCGGCGCCSPTIRHSAPRRTGSERHVMLTRSMRWFGSWGLPHLSDESLLELHALLLAGEHAVAARYLDMSSNARPARAASTPSGRTPPPSAATSPPAPMRRSPPRASSASSTSSCAGSRGTPAASCPSPRRPRPAPAAVAPALGGHGGGLRPAHRGRRRPR